LTEIAYLTEDGARSQAEKRSKKKVINLPD